MDKKQLAVLLRNYHRQLDDAIENVEKEIPEEMREKYKDMLGFSRERIPVLQSLYDLSLKIDEDIERLEE